MSEPKQKLSFSALTLAFACIGAIKLGLIGFFAAMGPGQPLLNVISPILLGMEATPAGVFVGIVWGFFLGGLCGALLAWLYNKMR